MDHTCKFPGVIQAMQSWPSNPPPTPALFCFCKVYCRYISWFIIKSRGYTLWVWMRSEGGLNTQTKFQGNLDGSSPVKSLKIQQPDWATLPSFGQNVQSNRGLHQIDSMCLIEFHKLTKLVLSCILEGVRESWEAPSSCPRSILINVNFIVLVPGQRSPRMCVRIKSHFEYTWRHQKSS